MKQLYNLFVHYQIEGVEHSGIVCMLYCDNLQVAKKVKDLAKKNVESIALATNTKVLQIDGHTVYLHWVNPLFLAACFVEGAKFKVKRYVPKFLISASENKRRKQEEEKRKREGKQSISREKILQK